MASADRLKQYLIVKGMNNREADDLFGFSNGLTGKFLTGKTSLSVDKIENILSVCPDLNADWLITGRGAMLVTEHGQTLEQKADYNRSVGIESKIAELEARLKDKDEIIEALKETIKLYKSLAKNRTNST